MNQSSVSLLCVYATMCFCTAGGSRGHATDAVCGELSCESVYAVNVEVTGGSQIWNWELPGRYVIDSSCYYVDMMHFISAILLLVASSDAFAPSSRLSPRSTLLYASQDWIPLVTDSSDISPVKKLILEEGEGELPADGSSVEIEYTGTLVGEKDWSARDIADCWLSELQGLDHLKADFLQNNIDFALLSDKDVFTEEFCTTTLGISNKIQAKKLIMARNRLSKTQDEHPAGTVFDSSAERGRNFTFNLGKGAIKGIDLAVRSMKVGEKAIVMCRADYGYGPEGLRNSKGDVMVPPFSTLNFELKRVC